MTARATALVGRVGRAVRGITTTACSGTDAALGRRDVAVGLLLGLGTFAIYACVSPARSHSSDGQQMYAVARNLFDHHSLAVPRPIVPKGCVTSATTSQPIGYSHYGIGVSLLLLPAYAAQKWLGMCRDDLVLLANPVVLALTTAVVYAIGRALRLRRLPALAGALGFGLLSMASAYSMELFSEPLVALGAALLILGLLRWRAETRGGPLLAGLGVAVALLARTDSALLVGSGLALVPWFVPVRRLRRVGPLLLAGAPVLAAVAWTVWYARLRDGTWWPTVYGGSFDFPMATGVHGLLYSPGKGFLWYNPFLLLGLPGLAVLWARDRAAAALLTFLVAARVLLYARWHYWHGDAAWGPRFLLPACVPLAVATALALDRIQALRTLPGRLATGALALAGAVVSAVSVAAPYWLWWSAIHRPLHPVPRAERARVVAQQLADMQWTWRLSGLHGSFRLLGHRPSQPVHFAGGPDTIAVATLLVAATCLLVAAMLAQSTRGLHEPGGTASSDRHQPLKLSSVNGPSSTTRAK
jgi:hypothetical protein